MPSVSAALPLDRMTPLGMEILPLTPVIGFVQGPVVKSMKVPAWVVTTGVCVRVGTPDNVTTGAENRVGE